MQRNEVINFRDYHSENDADRDHDDDAVEWLPAGTKLLYGQYKITAYHNSGGFGITYRATDSLGRDVVIKECFPGVMCFRADKEVRVRSKDYTEEYSTMIRNFVQEAHALAAMDHKNIIKVHQVFEENNSAYMVIDYIEGLDLLAIAEDHPNRLTPQEIERLTRQMLRAIRYVHEHDMLHRDISPDNILLDGDDEPILIDFGAAREKAKKSGRAMSRLKFVKDGYSPQEFYVEGAEQGPWSDLYSFAASIYHLISGAAPVDSQIRLAAAASKEPDPYVPLFGNTKGYTRGFLKAVDKALEILPNERFQTAEDWLQALSSYTGRKRTRSRGQTSRSSRSLPPPTPPRRPSQNPLSQGQFGEPGEESHTNQSPTSSPLVLERSSQITSHEQDVRDSMKSEVYAEQPSKAPLMLAAACGAVVSVLGTVGLFLFGGGNDSASIPSEVEPLAVPAPVTRQEQPDSSTEIASAPQITDPSAPGFEPLTFEEILAGGKSDDSAPIPRETAPTAEQDVASLAPSEATDQIALPDSNVVASVPTTPTTDTEATTAPTAPDNQLVTVPDNDAQFAALALATNEPTEIPGLPKVDPARLVSNVAPTVSILGDAGALSADPTPDTAPDVTVSVAAAAPMQSNDVTLPDILPGAAPVIQTAAPAPLPEAAIAQSQVTFSHWNVDMPFASEIERIRNANTAKITSVSPNANLSVSGEWIAEGVTIYAYNGESLIPDTPMSTQILNTMTIDPDGFARSTVRYQPEGGTIDRGLLAVPIVREIGLADGTKLVARNVDREWKITVAEFGNAAQTSLRIGDQLLTEKQTGIGMANHEDVARALDSLAADGISTAEFDVVRGGDIIGVTYKLAKEGQ